MVKQKYSPRDAMGDPVLSKGILFYFFLEEKNRFFHSELPIARESAIKPCILADSKTGGAVENNSQSSDKRKTSRSCQLKKKKTFHGCGGKSRTE